MAGERWQQLSGSDLISAGKLVIGDGYRAKNEEVSNIEINDVTRGEVG